MLKLFEFITLTLPKAGTAVYALPLTIANVMFLIAILRLGRNIFIGFSVLSKGMLLAYILYAYILCMVILVNFEYATSHMRLLAYALVMLAAPLTLSVGYSIDPQKSMKILTWSVIITSVYGLMQFIFGVEEMAIKGITLAVGETYTTKNIYRWINGIPILSKIPSTYQNGSLFAPFLLMAVSLLLGWEHSKGRKAAVILGVIAFALTGSRCSMIAVILVIFLAVIVRIVKTRVIRIKKRTFYVILIAGAVAFFVLSSGGFSSLISRLNFAYIEITRGDATAGGRTTAWLRLFKFIHRLDINEFIQFLVLGVKWEKVMWTEGLTYFLTLTGVVTTGLFVSFIAIIENYLYRSKQIFVFYGVLALFIVFWIDGTYIYTPTLINFFLMIGIALRIGHDTKRVQII